MASHVVYQHVPQHTHHAAVGYVAWLFGFMGAHRFYFGKPLTGILWLFTFGLLGVGWIVDLFLIPSMEEEADRKFQFGPLDYNVAWFLLAFPITGVLGFHRFYMGKWITGVIYLLTGGLLGIGLIYDWLTLNDQISRLNRTQGF
ncbi:MAG: NINE protein [Pirellulaceae bacterium]|nr:NINE protein [Planctomycetales bacterium]